MGLFLWRLCRFVSWPSARVSPCAQTSACDIWQNKS